jgi:hypothetical protein
MCDQFFVGAEAQENYLSLQLTGLGRKFNAISDYTSFAGAGQEKKRRKIAG